MRTHYCGQVNETLIGSTVTVAGWVHRRRDHGGVIFVDLRDRDGLVQIVCDPDAPELFAEAEKLRNEFVVSITGLVRARPEGTTNANLASGKVAEPDKPNAKGATGRPKLAQPRKDPKDGKPKFNFSDDGDVFDPRKQ